MRWQPAHLSGVAPASTTCGPPSADAVPLPPPRPARNATAIPAAMPISRIVFRIVSPPLLDISEGRPRPRPPGPWPPYQKECAQLGGCQYFHIWTLLLDLSVT